MEFRPEDFDSLYRENGARLFSLSRRLVGNEDVAADVVQDSFLKAFSQAGQNVENPAALLTVITRNTAIDAVRKKVRRNYVDRTDHEEDSLQEHADARPLSDPAERVAARSELDFVWGLIDELKPDQRMVLILRADGMDDAEIGRQLDKASGNIAVIAHRARAAIRGKYAARVLARHEPLLQSCSQYRDDLLKRAADEKTDDEFAHHFQACTSCQTIVDELEGMGRLASVLPLMPAPAWLGASIKTAAAKAALPQAVGATSSGATTNAVTSAGTHGAKLAASRAFPIASGGLSSGVLGAVAAIAAVVVIAAGSVFVLAQNHSTAAAAPTATPLSAALTTSPSVSSMPTPELTISADPQANSTDAVAVLYSASTKWTAAKTGTTALWAFVGFQNTSKTRAASITPTFEVEVSAGSIVSEPGPSFVLFPGQTLWPKFEVASGTVATSVNADVGEVTWVDQANPYERTLPANWATFPSFSLSCKGTSKTFVGCTWTNATNFSIKVVATVYLCKTVSGSDYGTVELRPSDESQAVVLPPMSSAFVAAAPTVQQGVGSALAKWKSGCTYFPQLEMTLDQPDFSAPGSGS